MTQTHDIRTPAAVRAEFARKGLSIAEWARENGLSVPRVYDVLLGRNKGVRGDAHKAAVALGLKEGEIIQ